MAQFYFRWGTAFFLIEISTLDYIQLMGTTYFVRSLNVYTSVFTDWVHKYIHESQKHLFQRDQIHGCVFPIMYNISILLQQPEISGFIFTHIENDQ